MVLLVKTDCDNTILPFAKAPEKVLVERIFDPDISKRLKRGSVIHYFTTVENNRFVWMRREITTFQCLNFRVHSVSNIVEVYYNPGQAKKPVVRFVRVAKVGVPRFINIEPVFTHM
jgi:hypothetical protein